MSQSQIEKIEKQIAQLNAKKQQLKAKQDTQERKNDTRRKILVGAVILKKVESGEWPKEKMLSMLDSELKQDRDRAMFGLAPLPKTTETD